MRPSWAALLAGVLLALLVIPGRTLLLMVRVRGRSMMPALADGDRVLVLQFWPARWLRKGWIVVTRIPPPVWGEASPPACDGTGLYVKRVAGLPCETLVAPGPPRLASRERALWWRVPGGHFFVSSDGGGYDSTGAGPVPFDALVGVVLARMPRGRD